MAANVAASAHFDVLTAQTSQFSNTQACLDSKCYKSVVATTTPRLSVWCSQDCIDLRRSQKIHNTAVAPLGGNGKNSLNKGAMFRMLKRHVVEERMYRCQPQISGFGAVVSFLLQVVEELADEWGIKILQRQLRWRLFQAFLRVPKQQPEAISV
jgi:hypothetical protein